MSEPDPRLDRDRCFLSIAPWRRSAEMQAWAGMLYRMYRRFAERRGYESRVIAIEGAEPGIRAVTVELRGTGCARLLAGEAGVHRLTRVSPFGDSPRRCSSFASVEVTADPLDSSGFVLDEDDLRVAVEGPCGVVQYEGCAVGIPMYATHHPTGMVARCSTGTQLEIRADALRVLRAKVFACLARGGTEKPDWNKPIRSYVLSPYEKVRDRRTQVETADVTAVLDGDLEFLLEVAGE